MSPELSRLIKGGGEGAREEAGLPESEAGGPVGCAGFLGA